MANTKIKHEMKKKVKMLILAVLSVMVTICSLLGNRQSVEMNVLMLENVEALAAGEDDGKVFCVGVGSIDCPINHRKVAHVYRPYSLFD